MPVIDLTPFTTDIPPNSDNILLNLVPNAHNTQRGLQGGTPDEYFHLREGYYITDDDELWIDIQSPLIGQRLNSPSGKVGYDYLEASVVFEPGGNINTVGDLIINSIQLPHEVKLNTIAKLHIHWEQPNATDRQFTIKHRIQRNGQPKTTEWITTIVNTNANSPFTYTSGTLNQVSRLVNIDLAGIGISSVIQIQLARTDSNAGDISATFLDLHVQVDGFGSRGEWFK